MGPARALMRLLVDCSEGLCEREWETLHRCISDTQLGQQPICKVCASKA